MAGNRRTVEFIFKARNEASAAVDALGEALRGLKTAQSQAASSTGAANPALAQQRTLAQQLTGAVNGLKAAFTGTAAAQAEAAAAVNKATAEYAGQAAKVKALRTEQAALNARVKELSLAGNIVQQFEKLSAEIDKLAQREKAAKVEVDRLTLSLQRQQMAQVLAGEAGNSGARVAEIKKTEAAIAALNKELSNTGKKLGIEQQLAALTADLDKLSAKAQKAGVATADLVKPLNALQVELAQVKAQAAALDPALARDAGQMAMLGNRVKALTGDMRHLAATEAKVAAQHKAGMDHQRTSLSFYQRLRGQVLGITAAYVGLYGVVNQVTQAFKAGATQRGIENTLVAFNGGDQAAAAAELQYTRRLADELGQQYLTLGASYAKFRAAIGDKLPLEKQRFLFESVAKAATVLRLSTEDTEGVFVALNQMFSKGSINAEELRQQLGDRMPGAVRLLAEGMGIAEKDLMKLMETGRLSAENMLLFAEQANSKFGPGLVAALKSPQAQLNRLVTKVADLRIAFERAAEQAGIGDVLRKIGDALSDPKVKAGIESLARFFVDMLSALPVLIQHIGTLAAALRVLAVAFVALRLGAIVTSLFSAAKGVGFLTIAVRGLGAAIRANPIGLLATALYALYEIADAFFKSHPGLINKWVLTVVRAWQIVVSTVSSGWSHLSEGLKGIWSSISFNVQIVFAKAKLGILSVIGLIDVFVKDRLNKFLAGAAKVADAMGNKDFAAKLRGSMVSYNEDLLAAAEEAAAEVTALEQAKADDMLGIAAQAQVDRDALRKKDLENEKKYRAELSAIDAAVAPKAGAAAAPFAFSEGGDNKPVIDAGTDKAADKAATALDNLLEKTRDAMAEIAVEIAKGTTFSMEGEMAAIEAAYVELFVDIQELASKGAISDTLKKQWVEQLDAVIAIQKKKLRDAALTMRGDALRGALDARLGTISDAESRGDITPADALQQRAAIQRESSPDILQNLGAQLGVAQQDLAASQIANDETAIALGREKVALLNQQIAATKELETGLLTVKEADEAIAAGLTDTAFALGDAIAAGDSLSDAFKAAGDAFRSFAAGFLRDIAQMIIKAMILKSIKGTGIGEFFSGLTGGVSHAGGVIGNGRADRTRTVSPMWFANAQRFHAGGLPGLSADEVPAILQKGEEVLSKSSPRNVLNGGGKTGGTQAAPQNIKIMNLIDSKALASELGATPEFERAVANVVRANKSTYRSLLS